MVGRSQMGCIWTNPLWGPVPVEIWPVTRYKLRCNLASLKPDQWHIGRIENCVKSTLGFRDCESSAFLSFHAMFRMFRAPFPLLVPCIGRQITWITESSLSSTESPELQEQHWNSQHNSSDFWDKVFQQFHYWTPGSQKEADPQHRVCILSTMYPQGLKMSGPDTKITKIIVPQLCFWQYLAVGYLCMCVLVCMYTGYIYIYTHRYMDILSFQMSHRFLRVKAACGKKASESCRALSAIHWISLLLDSDQPRKLQRKNKSEGKDTKGESMNRIKKPSKPSTRKLLCAGDAVSASNSATPGWRWKGQSDSGYDWCALIRYDTTIDVISYQQDSIRIERWQTSLRCHLSRACGRAWRGFSTTITTAANLPAWDLVTLSTRGVI